MGVLRVAAVQLQSRQDVRENLAHIERMLEHAVARGAQVVALPENCSFVGRDADKVRHAEQPAGGPTVDLLGTFAAQHRITIVGGTVPLVTDDPAKVTNSCLVFDPAGAIVARYDKLHLFDVAVDERNTFQESASVRPGRAVVTVEIFGHTMGLTICYDLRFPELYRVLAGRGAEVVFVPSAFTRQTGRDHWELLVRARAVENLCYVVAPAQCGEHGAGRVSFGRTMVVGPWGQVLAQCQDGEGLIVCDVDLALVAEARHRLPSLSHRRLGISEEPDASPPTAAPPPP